MFTVAFWKGAAERGIKTFAQSLLGSLLLTIPVLDQAWLTDLGIAATATVISLLTSITNPAFVAGAPAADGRHEADASTPEE